LRRRWNGDRNAHACNPAVFAGAEPAGALILERQPVWNSRARSIFRSRYGAAATGHRRPDKQKRRFPEGSGVLFDRDT